jgi:hypothetical protein
MMYIKKKIFSKLFFISTLFFLISFLFVGEVSALKNCSWNPSYIRYICTGSGSGRYCSPGSYSCTRGCCDYGTGGGGGGGGGCSNSCPVTAAAKASPWVEGTAPASYIASCKSTTSKTGKTSSCGSCSSTRNWYLPNLPSTPPPLANGVQYCLNGNCQNLSVDSANPTVVARPESGDNIRLKVITGAKDPDAREWRYWWRLNNSSISAPWTCASTNNGTVNTSIPASDNDLCQKNDTNNTTINLANTLIEGDNYYVAYNTGWLRSCTNTPLYQADPGGVGALRAYFYVDYSPTEVGGSSDSSVSGTEVDTDNGPSCSDNNPFEFKIRYQDLDGFEELEQLGFWVDDSSPTFANMRNSIRGKVVKNGSTWEAFGTSCDSSGNNCSWDVAGSAVPLATQNICTIPGDWSDYAFPNVLCTSPVGSWTVLDIVEIGLTDLEVTYKVWINEDIGTDLKVYGKSWDIHGVSVPWDDLMDRTLDLNGPTTTMVSPLRVVNNTVAELEWSVVDGVSGVADVYGKASLHTSGLVDGPINDVTSGVNGYDIRIDPDDRTTGVDDLWHYTASPVGSSPFIGTEEIDFLTNEGNQIAFGADSVDVACNLVESPDTVQVLDDPWFITRGGNVYSSFGALSPSHAISGTGVLSTLTPESSLWSSPFRFTTEDPNTGTNDVAPSTELFLIGGGVWNFPSKVTNPAIGFGLIGRVDRNGGSPVYDSMYSSITSNYSLGVNILTLGSNSIDTSVIDKSSDLAGCSAASLCLYTVSGDLEILTSPSSTPFTCDKPTVFMVSGDILLEPNILKGSGPKDGCMFVSGSDITVATGMDQIIDAGCNSGTLENAELCYPPYDLLEGFLLADGHIILEEDVPSLLYEGLLIHGSVLALGGNDADPSIHWSRSLKLINNPRFPSLVVHYDPVYLDIGKDVFRFDYPAYVVDVGYKP